ncbi:MAG: nitrate- and nitrite sensing domain-containing protein [Campylobacterota bacterium]|nr:nitrate- and nitrite sensing domain-containing protein [Campylobacterota bacterium]
MFKFFNNLSIKLKLRIALFIPVIALAYFILYNANQSYEKHSELSELKQSLNISIYTSNLIHEIQKERGLSAGYLGSNGKKFHSQLIIQRKLTDEKLNILKSNIIEKEIFKEINKLSSTRIKIDSLEISSKDSIIYFSIINTNLLNKISHFSIIYQNNEILKMIFSYINLLKAKENAGIERAVLNSTFASGKITNDTHKWFHKLYTTQEIYLKTFKSSIDNNHLTYFNSKMNDASIKEVEKLRSIAFNKIDKDIIISKIKDIIGYGGLIHNFKNYILRGDKKYYDKFQIQYTQLLKETKKYGNLATTTKKEKELLIIINNTFKKYSNDLDDITQIYKNNNSIKNLDTIIKVNDNPAIDSINILSNNILGADAMYWYKVSTHKINILKEIEDKYASNIYLTMDNAIKDITNNQIFNFIFIFIIYLIISTISFLLISDITTSIKKVQYGLLSFSKYITGNSKKIEPIEIYTDDELGQMAITINQYIKKTKTYLDRKVQQQIKINTARNKVLAQKTKELKKLNKELEERIEKALRENNKQLKLLEEQNKLAAMGEMIGSIAHQWRQPLNELGIGIQNLKYDYKFGTINEEFIEEFITYNYNIIQFMSNTIDDFRNFFKTDKIKSDFYIKENIKTVCTMISGQLNKHNITVNITGDDFSYTGTKSEFKQVILNLINNAKDALTTFSIINPTIDIKLEDNKITIKDNAGGIHKDILDRIFEPYFTTKEQGKGTGVGLYMSKTIIENNMNGKLKVYNQDNGAVFEIDFGTHKG